MQHVSHLNAAPAGSKTKMVAISLQQARDNGWELDNSFAQYDLLLAFAQSATAANLDDQGGVSRSAARLATLDSRPVLFSISKHKDGSIITSQQPLPGVCDDLRSSREEAASFLFSVGNATAAFFYLLRSVITAWTIMALSGFVLGVVSLGIGGTPPTTSSGWAFGSSARCEGWSGVFVAFDSCASLLVVGMVFYYENLLLQFLPQSCNYCLQQSHYSVITLLPELPSSAPELETELKATIQDTTQLQVQEVCVTGRYAIVSFQRRWACLGGVISRAEMLDMWHGNLRCRCCCEIPQITFQGSPITFAPAPPASCIYFENFGKVPWCSMACRRICFWIVLLAIIAGFSAWYYRGLESKYKSTSYGSRDSTSSDIAFAVIPPVATLFLNTVVGFVEENLQRSETRDYREQTLYVYTSTLSIIISVLMPFLASAQAARSSNYLTDLEQRESVFALVTSTAFSSGLVSLAMEVVQPRYWIHVAWSWIRKPTTQEGMDKAYQLLEFRVSLKYAEVTTMIAFSFLYGGYCPMLYPLTQVTFLLQYIVSRFTLFTWFQCPAQVGSGVTFVFLSYCSSVLVLVKLSFWMTVSFSEVFDGINNHISQDAFVPGWFTLLCSWGAYMLFFRPGVLVKCSSKGKEEAECASVVELTYEDAQCAFKGTGYRDLRDRLCVRDEPEMFENSLRNKSEPIQTIDL